MDDEHEIGPILKFIDFGLAEERPAARRTVEQSNVREIGQVRNYYSLSIPVLTRNS